MFKRFVFTLVALLAVVSGTTAHTNHAPFLTSIIQPVQWMSISHADHMEHLFNHCTAFSIRPEYHGWMSDAHCVLDKNGEVADRDFYIGGHKAVPYNVSVEKDLVLFQVVDGYGVRDPEVDFVKLAKRGPKQGELLETMGFLFGYPRPAYFAGFMAIESFFFHNHMWSLAAFEAIGGQSGSPILNQDGRLVGLVHIGLGCDDSCGAEDSVAGFEDFKDLVEYDEGWVLRK